jgi:hypothetical protein
MEASTLSAIILMHTGDGLVELRISQRLNAAGTELARLSKHVHARVPATTGHVSLQPCSMRL